MQSISVGRQFNSFDTLESENSDSNDVLDYNMNDILCIPRNYCEKMKRKKYMLDQYPTVKNIAAVVAGAVFNKDSALEMAGSSLYKKCHFRDCVFDLFR